jgi:phenylpropionate dioxygenase-like ring-hydroxylating dioxygenase large terminal subunit
MAYAAAPPAKKHERYAETELISSERYTSREQLEIEYERLWPRVWQMAGREEDIPESGDFLEYTIGAQSILLLRVAPDQIKAYHNSCMHRGTLLVQGQGNVRNQPCTPGNEGKLQCTFHGWAYNLDGSIHFMPGGSDFAPSCVAKDEIRLREVQVDTWGGFIFINMDRTAPGLREWLGPIPDRLERFALDKMRTLQHLTVVVGANWKLAVEQFHENYHAWATHIMDLNEVGAPATGAGGRQAGQEGTRGGGVPPQAIMYMFDYEVYDNHSLFWQLDWRPTAGMPPVKLREVGPDPRGYVRQALQYMSHNRRIAPYEIEYFETMDELPLDMDGPEFMVKLRRDACAAQGLDLSHIEDHEMWGFPIEYLFFPNMTGPVAGNSYLNLRIRPNGMDPDTCVFEIRSLFLFPEGKAPVPQREFIADWESNRDRIPVEFLQDFAMYPKIQQGLHQRSFPGSRLSRQEHNDRMYERTIDRFVLGEEGGKRWPTPISQK